MSAAAPAIRARALHKRFGAFAALCGVDFQLERGACLALLGPNGAGKTTLLRLLAGLARPTSGSLELGPEARSPRAARSAVGYVGHATLLYGALSARENLVFAGRMHGVDEPDARAGELLEAEGLAHVAERRAGTFSRGMGQRLAIARALVHDPALVLLDEPFTGLDRGAADHLSERIQSMGGQGRTCVLVTHDVERAASLADSALVLRRGRVVHESGEPPLDAAALDAACAAAHEAPR